MPLDLLRGQNSWQPGACTVQDCAARSKSGSPVRLQTLMSSCSMDCEEAGGKPTSEAYSFHETKANQKIKSTLRILVQG
jgi:hypothetical protein